MRTEPSKLVLLFLFLVSTKTRSTLYICENRPGYLHTGTIEASESHFTSSVSQSRAWSTPAQHINIFPTPIQAVGSSADLLTQMCLGKQCMVGVHWPGSISHVFQMVVSQQPPPTPTISTILVNTTRTTKWTLMIKSSLFSNRGHPHTRLKTCSTAYEHLAGFLKFLLRSAISGAVAWACTCS